MSTSVMHRRGGQQRRANDKGTTTTFEDDSFEGNNNPRSHDVLDTTSFDGHNGDHSTTPSTAYLKNMWTHVLAIVYQVRILKQKVWVCLRHPHLSQHVSNWFHQPENLIFVTMTFFLLLFLGTVINTTLYPPPGMRIRNSPGSVSRSGTRNVYPNPMEQGFYDTAFGPDGVEYHMIFSTGCSTFQDWQSYVFFYHAWKSGQPGHVTRIASGCSDEDSFLLQKMHREQIDIMSPGRFHLHITPEYSKIKPGVTFKYFNKPFGVRHWMEHALGYPGNTVHDDAVVMLLDPDQIVLRPFTKDFSNSTEIWLQPNLNKLKVEHGQPFGQRYGFASQWKTNVNMSHVFANQHSRVDDVSVEDAGLYYAAGPPYVATARDMYRIVKTWSDVVPLVHDSYPYLLAEMFAYCLAAAHENLPHQMATGFMVSDVNDPKGEGWELIDPYPKNDVCYIPQENLPHVLHYCQRYNLGKWHFGKFRLRKDFLSCESSLLMEPPPDVASKYVFSVTPDKELNIWRHPQTGKRNGFMLCFIIRSLNQAAIFYKQHHCPIGTANFVKNYTFHDNMEVEQMWLDKVTEELKKRPLDPVPDVKKQKLV